MIPVSGMGPISPHTCTSISPHTRTSINPHTRTSIRPHSYQDKPSYSYQCPHTHARISPHTRTRISPHTHPYKMSTDSMTLKPLCGSGLQQLTAGSAGLVLEGIWTWLFTNLTKRSRTKPK